mmetsp:Transcript_11488/g.35844  ORF Transcript_11488/g.35844 Transcript_11488/m.35844 type:complete len:204 (+) Transcript_11488:189-800(+)
MRSVRSWSFMSFCSFCTLPLKLRRSISTCFLRAAMRCWRSSSSRRAWSASRWSCFSCAWFSLMSAWSFLKTWFICKRSLRVESIFLRIDSFSWHRLLSWLVAFSSLCSSFRIERPLGTLEPGSGWTAFGAWVASATSLGSAFRADRLPGALALCSSRPARRTFSSCSARTRSTSSSSLFNLRFSSSSFRVVDSISLCIRCMWS